jgi:hypothetical protein
MWLGVAIRGTYTRGGTVMTCGATDWAHGLRGEDPAVERITRNALDRPGKCQRKRSPSFSDEPT